jgi:hypothetical protein
MRIGYCKIGRSWNLNPEKWSASGGDMDVWRLLMRLATMHPEHEFVLIGRNSGEEPTSVGMPANITNPWVEWLKQMKADKEAIRTPDPRYEGITTLKNSGLITWYDENVLPTFRDLDHVIVWAGQHGTSNSPLPPIGGTWAELTKPQDSSVIYGSYIVRGINAFRQADPRVHEEIWLCPDPRNYLKMRDLKWPLNRPVLAQYEQKRALKHERYGDQTTPEQAGFTAKVEGSAWIADSRYIYSALELTMLPEPHELPCNVAPGTHPIGLIVNENRAYVADNRLKALQEWILPFWSDCPIYGKWLPESEKAIGRAIPEVPVMQMYDVARQFRSTFTMPASGSGWATGKPWESFALGVVCFFHPRYDTQGHIVPTLKQVEQGKVQDPDLAALAQWLRVQSPAELQSRVNAIATDDGTWAWLAGVQRRHYESRFAERRIETLINERMGLTDG